MRTTLLRSCLALEIILQLAGCAQTPLLEDFEAQFPEEDDDDGPRGSARPDGGGKDAGSRRDAGARKDAGASVDPGESEEDPSDGEEDPSGGEDGGAVKDASTKDASTRDASTRDAAVKDAGASRDAAASTDAGRDAGAQDARVSLPNNPPADAAVTPVDAGSTTKPDAATSQPNQCVAEECPDCPLLATACCNSSNKCACRIGLGLCFLPSIP